jgi:hypothetical protein
MKRLLGLAALVAALPAAAAGGAEVALTAGPPRGGTIYVYGADGTQLRTIATINTSSADLRRELSWSPDGTKLVFAGPSASSPTLDLYVADSDGGNRRRLTTETGGSDNVVPRWSPNGATIAWLRSSQQQSELWTSDPQGSGKRRLAVVPGTARDLRWSPDSTRLLLGADSSYVVAARDGATVKVVSYCCGSWSPDGSLLAFPGVVVMRADGSDAHTISSQPGGNPEWSPDGSKIAFVARYIFWNTGSRYGGQLYRDDVYVVGADGSDERRLTGPLSTPAILEAGDAVAPTWWPDGSRLFFTALIPGGGSGERTTWQMNADGTCESAFSSSSLSLLMPAWRPASAPLPPPPHCVDIRLWATGVPTPVGMRAPVVFSLTLENDGNQRADDVVVRATGDGAMFNFDGCGGAVCSVGALSPRSTRLVSGEVVFPRAGVVRLRFAASADGQPESAYTSQEPEAVVQVLPCGIVGTTGNDRITGTVNADRICALPGSDRIDAFAGNDRVDAGSGNDTAVGGRGRDTIDGGGGNDVILVRDGERDVVRCGSEFDVVLADTRDRVARDCERVIRTG